MCLLLFSYFMTTAELSGPTFLHYNLLSLRNGNNWHFSSFSSLCKSLKWQNFQSSVIMSKCFWGLQVAFLQWCNFSNLCFCKWSQFQKNLFACLCKATVTLAATVQTCICRFFFSFFLSCCDNSRVWNDIFGQKMQRLWNSEPKWKFTVTVWLMITIDI